MLMSSQAGQAKAGSDSGSGLRVQRFRAVRVNEMDSAFPSPCRIWIFRNIVTGPTLICFVSIGAPVVFRRVFFFTRSKCQVT